MLELRKFTANPEYAADSGQWLRRRVGYVFNKTTRLYEDQALDCASMRDLQVTARAHRQLDQLSEWTCTRWRLQYLIRSGGLSVRRRICDHHLSGWMESGRLPDSALTFMRQFDNGEPVEPFELRGGR